MMTSLAPHFLAISGKPAAGQTTSDDPIARKRSHCCASSVARRIASSGIACPNEIVAVASRLFARQGVAATRMSDIADGAGLKQSSIYYYFRGKEEILGEIVARASGRDYHDYIRENVYARAGMTDRA